MSTKYMTRVTLKDGTVIEKRDRFIKSVPGGIEVVSAMPAMRGVAVEKKFYADSEIESVKSLREVNA